MNEPADGDLFIRRLTELNAIQNQQMLNILNMVALAVQIKNLSVTDMSQAVIESKMAALLNTARGNRPVEPSTPNQKDQTK